MDFLSMRGDGTVIDAGEYIPDFSDCITIPVYDNVKKKKYNQKKYPSRAKKKRELQTIIEESELIDDDFER